MAIEYKNFIYHSEAILIRKFCGKVTVDDIIASWEYLLSNNLIKKELKGVINNLFECDLEMDLDSFDTLITYLLAHPEFSDLKLAVVCDSPKKIIFPMMGENQVTELKIKPFSTVEAAINWISKS